MLWRMSSSGSSSRSAARGASPERRSALTASRLYPGGVGLGPPVVVLHGGPGAHHDYLLPQYDHLAEGGRALLYYDQRGGGRSPVPREVPVGWREHVADLEALRGHWELDRPPCSAIPGVVCSRCSTRSSTRTGSPGSRSSRRRP